MADDNKVTTASATSQTVKAIVRPAAIIGALTAAIPQPYINYVYVAWLAIVVACWDLRPPQNKGKWQPLLSALYKALNYIACNPQIPMQGLEANVINKAATTSTANTAVVAKTETKEDANV